VCGGPGGGRLAERGEHTRRSTESTQVSRRAGRQAGGQAGRQAGRQADRQAGRQADLDRIEGTRRDRVLVPVADLFHL